MGLDKGVYQTAAILTASAVDPLHIMGMQEVWSWTKQKKFSLLRIEKKILLFCPPDWLHSHRCTRGLLFAQGYTVQQAN